MTDSFILVSWSLPPTAMGDGIAINSYVVTATGLTTPKTVMDPGNRAINLVDTDFSSFMDSISITVTPNYATPTVPGNMAAGSTAAMVPASGAGKDGQTCGGMDVEISFISVHQFFYRLLKS